ncbi:MAG: HEAT repeat domain-containing protein [Desulfovibrio sp.]|nr:HEAT repeat domain-containing protein [Desulfovibrio sp.]
MTNFRRYKAELVRMCAGADWKSLLDQRINSAAIAAVFANPLLAILSRHEYSWQAAYGLGLAVSRMAEYNMESARNFMRRFMWSMNEESGNLGWGIPEAMGCILAQSPALAREYARIFLSYGRDTGQEDNFVDYAPLRRGVYWGIGRLAAADADGVKPALPHLVSALEDADSGVRCMAAFAIRELAENLPIEKRGKEEWAAHWRKAEDLLERGVVSAGDGPADIRLLDGCAIVNVSMARMFALALAILRRSRP